MARTLPEITAHIRAVCANPNVKTTLINTEDLELLCDHADANGVKPASQFLMNALAPKDWKAQSFEYYAAHYLVGTGLCIGDVDANVRGLAAELKKQYDIGVEHGRCCEFAKPL